MNDQPGAIPERIAVAAQAQHARIAVAESLTGGLVCSELASASDAGTWFAGGIVAYSSQVKYDLLGVPPGPVVSEAAARAMAEGVARLTDATHAVAVTGVGGPAAQDGQPVGTVWLAAHAGGETTARRLLLSGEPGTICREAVTHCLLALEFLLGRSHPDAAR